MGTASDDDPGDHLQYRWLNEGMLLADWADVGAAGECLLASCDIPFTMAGSYTLTLEVTDR